MGGRFGGKTKGGEEAPLGCKERRGGRGGCARACWGGDGSRKNVRTHPSLRTRTHARLARRPPHCISVSLSSKGFHCGHEEEEEAKRGW